MVAVQRLDNDMVVDAMVDDATTNHSDPRKRFLDGYAKHGTIVSAARMAGVGRSTVHDWINGAEGFKAEFEEAKQTFRESMEENALFRRLEEPNCPPLLVIFALKAQWREKYDDNAKPANTDQHDLLRRLEAMDAKSVKRAVLDDIKGGSNALGAERMFDDTTGQSVS